jgi:hypothetical protein
MWWLLFIWRLVFLHLEPKGVSASAQGRAFRFFRRLFVLEFFNTPPALPFVMLKRPFYFF